MGNIIVSEYGDELHYLGPDEDDITSWSINHKVCSGFVDVIETTAKFKVLLCRACGLRLVIPVETKTFADLQLAFEVMNSSNRSWSCHELPGRSWGLMHEANFQDIRSKKGHDEAMKFAAGFGWTAETINDRNKI